MKHFIIFFIGILHKLCNQLIILIGFTRKIQGFIGLAPVPKFQIHLLMLFPNFLGKNEILFCSFTAAYKTRICKQVFGDQQKNVKEPYLKTVTGCINPNIKWLFNQHCSCCLYSSNQHRRQLTLTISKVDVKNCHKPVLLKFRFIILKIVEWNVPFTE